MKLTLHNCRTVQLCTSIYSVKSYDMSTIFYRSDSRLPKIWSHFQIHTYCKVDTVRLVWFTKTIAHLCFLVCYCGRLFEGGSVRKACVFYDLFVFFCKEYVAQPRSEAKAQMDHELEQKSNFKDQRRDVHSYMLDCGHLPFCNVCSFKIVESTIIHKVRYGFGGLVIPRIIFHSDIPFQLQFHFMLGLLLFASLFFSDQTAYLAS